MDYVLRRFRVFQDGMTEKMVGLRFWVFGVRFVDTPPPSPPQLCIWSLLLRSERLKQQFIRRKNVGAHDCAVCNDHTASCACNHNVLRHLTSQRRVLCNKRSLMLGISIDHIPTSRLPTTYPPVVYRPHTHQSFTDHIPTVQPVHYYRHRW